MIICEGADGSGKTTLCKKICDHFGFEMGERGTTNRDLLYTVTRPDTYRAIYEELLADDKPLVWDRLGPWSDPIYSAMQNRPCAFTPTELYLVRMFTRNLRIPIIICMPDCATVMANAVKGHQMSGVKKNLMWLYDQYEALVRTYADNMANMIVYDYEKDDIQRVFELINLFLGARRERQLCTSYSTPVT